MRVLALDYGRARCGCAVSDPTGVLASPVEAVRAPTTRRGLARLRTLVAELEIQRVVVGLPLSLSGRDSAQTVETRAFNQRGERVCIFKRRVMVPKREAGELQPADVPAGGS